MESMNYLDFELEIGIGSGRDYPVVVVRSPAGEARETMRFPFDELMLENRLQALQIALLRSGGKQRRLPSPEEKIVQDFGRALYEALLSGEVRSRYDVSFREATQAGKGLRLKLRIQSPEMAALPWEFLYDSRQGEYLALVRNTPIVRYLELPQPIQPLAVPTPLRVLGMIASPKDLVSLNYEHEKQRVENALRDLRAQGLVMLEWLQGETWRDLQRAMRGGPWHVFHFIGHGGFDRNADEGLIVLSNEKGYTYRLSATQLGRLLANHRTLRLVLLNACEGARGGEVDIFSSAAATLVRRGIAAVVAMQHEITDRAAIEFSRVFYEALADGMPVDAAVSEARTAISLAVANTVEWGTPVLHMRSPDGVLFSLSQHLTVEEERLTARSKELMTKPPAQPSDLASSEARKSLPKPTSKPALELTLFANRQTVDIGHEVTWRISLRNVGIDNLSQIRLMHGQTLLVEPFDLAAGERWPSTFTTTYNSPGEKAEKIILTGVASSGETVRVQTSGTVTVHPSRRVTLRREPEPTSSSQVIIGDTRPPSFLRRWWRVGALVLLPFPILVFASFLTFFASPLIGFTLFLIIPLIPVVVGIEHLSKQRRRRGWLFILASLGWVATFIVYSFENSTSKGDPFVVTYCLLFPVAVLSIIAIVWSIIDAIRNEAL